MRLPPQFGQNINRDVPTPGDDNRFDELIQVIERMANTVSVIIREIAGLSITKVTDEVTVFPVDIIGIDQILVRVTPTALTQVDARYLIGVKVDRGSEVDVLDLEEVAFSQDDIDNLTGFTFPFTVVDLEGVETFIVEAFLDAAVASVRVLPDPGSVGMSSNVDITIDTGSGGLAGYIIDINIVDASVAKIVNVFFPPELGLNQFDPDPVDGPTVQITAVDLGDSVKGGALGVRLATIQLEGLAVGTTAIDVEITQLDDDKGFPIRYTLTVDSFEVS